VPSLSGDVRAAVTDLAAKGFLVTLAYVPSDDPLGTVEAQSPQAGATASSGSHVTVNVSSGPGNKPQKTVPDLSGKSVDDALAAVKAAGLRLIVVKRPVTDRSLVGKVVEQTPAAGKTIPRNGQVLVYWGALEK
jgi:serine/threonine-protein kinase